MNELKQLNVATKNYNGQFEIVDEKARLAVLELNDEVTKLVTDTTELNEKLVQETDKLSEKIGEVKETLANKVFIATGEDYPSVDNTVGTITFPKTTHFICKDWNYALEESEVVVNLKPTSSSSISIVSINNVTNAISSYAYWEQALVDKDMCMICVVRRTSNTGGVSSVDIGVPYYIDGVLYGGAEEYSKFDYMWFFGNYGESEYGDAKQPYPEFDTVKKTFTLPYSNADAGIIYKGNVYSLSNYPITVVDISEMLSITSTSLACITFNVSTNEIKGEAYNKVSKECVVLAYIRLERNSDRISVSMNCPFYIDGNLYGIEKKPDEFTNIRTINHKGWWSAPENTLSAYRMSKKLGYKYVECDVSFTSDSVPVLLHDNTIDRTSNGTGNISEMTFEEVRQYDFGSWKQSEVDYSGEKIPSFEEFILLCKRLDLHPYIELKTGSPVYTNEQIYSLVDTVKRYGMKDNVTWISFSQWFLKLVINKDSTARVGYILETIDGVNKQTFIDNINELVELTDNLFVNCYYTGYSDDLLELCIEKNIPLEVWTVNEEGTLLSLNPYISGVTTDKLNVGNIMFKNTK